MLAVQIPDFFRQVGYLAFTVRSLSLISGDRSIGIASVEVDRTSRMTSPHRRYVGAKHSDDNLSSNLKNLSPNASPCLRVNSQSH